MPKPLSLPPEPILRAYLGLIHAVFVDLRSSQRFGELQRQYVYDLANAMHNVSFLIGEYDKGWLNDEKFRRMEIADFDKEWKDKGGIQLADYLEASIDAFRNPRKVEESERDFLRQYGVGSGDA